MIGLDHPFGKEAYQRKINQAQNLRQSIAPSHVIKARVAKYNEHYHQRRHLEVQRSLRSKPRLKHKLARWLRALAEKLEPSQAQTHTLLDTA